MGRALIEAVARGTRADEAQRRGVAKDSLMIAALVAALAVPFAVLGAGFFREDWFFLRRARIDGAWHAADPGLSRLRPLVRPLYALVYGVLGGHPLGVYALITVMNAGVAVALYLVCREWLSRRQAFVAAAVWALLPSHSAMSHWAAAIQIELSLLLVLLGVTALIRSSRRHRPAFLAAIFFVAAALLYEASLVVAAAAAVAIPLAIAGRRGWRLAVPFVALVPVAALVLAHSTRPPPQLVALGDIFPSNFGWGGWGVAGLGPLWLLVQLLVLAGIGWSLWRFRAPIQRRLPGPRTVAIGMGIVVLGVLPFIGYKFDIDYVGLGDRGNMISAVGAALVFAGLLAGLRTKALVTVLLALAALWIPSRIAEDRAWAATGRETRNALAYIQRCELPRAMTTPLVVGPWAIVHQGVEGLSTDGDVSDALQALRGDSRQPVRFVYTAPELAQEHGVDLRQAAHAGSRCGSR